MTPLIGRAAEIDEIKSKVLDPDYPLVTLVGEGGIGKTRLALAVAKAAKASFADGVWFVPLTGVAPPEDKTFEVSETSKVSDVLASTIGEALNLTFRGADSPTVQLCRQLRAKSLLLVLDNFEHLIAAAGFLPTLLQEAPQLNLLVTSHQRLNFQMEHVFRVEGLPVPQQLPASSAKNGLLDTYTSLQLFAERAERTGAGFTFNADNQHDIIRICRQVEGSPLGIELAAALIERQSCAEIAHALQQSVDTLSISMRDLPARHRSLRAVFDYAWRLLSEPEQTTLALATVFRGGFSREAARTVISERLSVYSKQSPAVQESTDHCLASLVERFLLRQMKAERYEIHPLVWQFAAEKRQALASQVDERHSRFHTERTSDE